MESSTHSYKKGTVQWARSRSPSRGRAGGAISGARSWQRLGYSSQGRREATGLVLGKHVEARRRRGRHTVHPYSVHICFASHACGRGQPQQPERELARPRAAARPWPRSPTVAHPARAPRESQAYPVVGRAPIQRSLLRTAENLASRLAYPNELPLRHVRPRFRLPASPARPRHASQGAYPSIATPYGPEFAASHNF